MGVFLRLTVNKPENPSGEFIKVIKVIIIIIAIIITIIIIIIIIIIIVVIRPVTRSSVFSGCWT